MDSTQKRRGLALATTGLGIAIAVIALLGAVRFIDVSAREWAVLAAACALTVGGAWLLLLAAPRAWRRWDPHFVLVPTLAVIVLLSVFVGVADEGRLLVLIVWPVVLIFLAGYVGFRTGALLSALMTGGYLAATALAGPPEAQPGVELILAFVFFVTMLFACVMLGRIRHQRVALAAARAELARLVYTDPLTNLPNRRRFVAAFEAEMSRVARFGGRFSLAVMDCDEFKAYNDCHGHPAGDEALCELASVLREQLRPGDLVARLGGEEFAVLMVDTDKGTANTVGEQVRRRVAGHAFGAGRHTLTLSIGIATAPEDADTPDALLRMADRALYAAKARGRNCLVLAEPAPAALPLG